MSLKQMQTLVFSLVLFCFNPWFSSSQYGGVLEEDIDSYNLETLSTNSWTEHVAVFEKIFKLITVDSFLEFGVGRSTKYFLDNCPNVASLELTCEYAPAKKLIDPWYRACVEKFVPRFPRWKHHMRNCRWIVDSTTYYYWEKDPTTLSFNPLQVSTKYLLEVRDICADGLKLLGKPCSLAFVDSGLSGRVDIVNELLRRRIPIVVAHDTNNETDQFCGYQRLEHPPQYTFIHCRTICGVSIWLRTDCISPDVIAKLRAYSDGLLSK
jgi:hypothetical protein